MDLTRMQLLECLLNETETDGVWAAQAAGITNTEFLRFHLIHQLAKHGDARLLDSLLNPQEQRRMVEAYKFARHLQAGFRLSPFHRRCRSSAPTHFEVRGGIGIIFGHVSLVHAAHIAALIGDFVTEGTTSVPNENAASNRCVSETVLAAGSLVTDARIVSYYGGHPLALLRKSSGELYWVSPRHTINQLWVIAGGDTVTWFDQNDVIPPNGDGRVRSDRFVTRIGLTKYASPGEIIEHFFKECKIAVVSPQGPHSSD